MNKIPKSLQNAIQTKQLIPIVGAGVSKSIKDKQGKSIFPNWHELLELAAQKLKEEAEEDNAQLVQVFLKKKDYQQAAKYAYEGLKGSNWTNFFKSQFDPDLASLDISSAALPKAIWNISNQLITLNYDKTLQWAHKQPTPVSIIGNHLKVELAALQKSNSDKPSVWHIHGHIDNSAELILTPEGYQKLYATSSSTDSDYRAAIETLQTLSRNKSFLFIGCSLDDAELLAEMHQQQTLFGDNTGPHFALVHKDEEPAIKTKLNDTNIKLIVFEDFGDPLVKLIESLADHNTQKPAPITVEQSPPPIINSKKIALLSANPLDQSQNYSGLLKEFKKIDCHIDHFSLSTENLNNLHDYDYLFILSKVIKNRLLIENEYLCSQNISFSKFEEQIGNDLLSGVFIFVDQLPDEANTEALRLPTLILPTIEKSKINNHIFKVFKKNDLKQLQNVQLLNSEAFHLSPLLGKSTNNTHHEKTKLPDNIDPKTVRHFIGRTNDLEQICRKLLSLEDESGVLTIKGSGGIGKTTTIKKLTVALAERAYFAGGISFVDCEFITDLQQFKYKVASAFNLEQAEDIQQHLSEHYDDQSRLIIIDNLETLLYLDDTLQIKAFLAFICDYATLVVTTRETLQIEGEIIYEMRQFTTDEAFELFTSSLGDREIKGGEINLLRQDILENLLDNNPLAITLITGNMPKGKSLFALKEELETNLFSKISDSELELFDDQQDLNIARKKSIYASVFYSYSHLTDEEQRAFELLSLFPDGIGLEQFKRLTSEQRNNNKKNNLTKKAMITDKVIKSLENKSMIENSRGQIKLQSIVGKFATVQLNQRENLTHYYQNALQYNLALVNALENRKKENKNQTLKIFNNQQANFLKSIAYSNQVDIKTSESLEFLNNLLWFYTNICSLKGFIRALRAQPENLQDMDRRCIKVILLNASYFDGDFKNAFNELKQLAPLESLASMDRSKFNERLLAGYAYNIFEMEGEALASAKYEAENNIFPSYYSNCLLYLGELNPQLADRSLADFFTLEARTNLGLLTYEEIDGYLNQLYDKSHLEHMQVSYTRSKMMPLDQEKIEKLVIVNPYTRGLKNLMLAFIEQDITLGNEYYKEALQQLSHIKYYYVEALFFYAKFLQKHNKSEFEKIYDEGMALSQKHHYRYLQYRLEQLSNPTNKAYSSQDYPLPNNEDFTDYIQKLIKNSYHQ